ncbi:MAG: hypothetical protein GTN99_06230, partial [Candidatus Dadabacteria bacterium]|nr:hypothetical protein [Candidatus Dadabacteria bacterium]
MSDKSKQSYDYKTSPIHRAMICAVDADGTTTAYYEIDDEEQLKKFESFFPGYREFVQSEDNTWGQTRYRIYL